MTTTDNLTRLSALADEMQDAEAEVARLEEDLRTAQQKLTSLREFKIPELMDEVGLTEFKTAAGFKLVIGDKIRAGNLGNPKLHAWLRECGHGGLIKSAVSVPFKKKGTDEVALALVQELVKRGLAAEYKQTVAWNSLELVVRELLEEGAEVPVQELGLHIQRTTNIER